MPTAGSSRERAVSPGEARVESAQGAVLSVRGLSKAFGKSRILEGLDLDVRKGENVAILGESGTGKSCLLRMIIGLMAPNAGQTFLWGQPTENLSEEDWIPLRRRMGLVFQSGALFDSMSVYDNIAFPLRERGGSSQKEIDCVVRERLEWIGLPGIEEQMPSQLSGGMRRRVALARTLAFDPEFVLYDEPTTGLAPRPAHKISTLMRDLNSQLKSTSILVTHDIDCARIVSTRWAYLACGKMVADGTPEDLLGSGDPELREFFAPSKRAQDLDALSQGEAGAP